MTDPEILLLLEREFGRVPRPAKFTCEDGDPECMDKDALLHSRTPATLTLEDVNNMSFNVWTECLTQGKAYYLPSMARLALAQQVEGEDEWYGSFLVSNLGQDPALFDFCCPSQRDAILNFMDHLLNTREAMESVFREEITVARERWWRAIHGLGFSF